MKDKLEIGMYVRTNEGFIAKLVEIKERHRYMDSEPIKYDYIFDKQIWDSRCTDGYYDDCELAEEYLDNYIVGEPSFEIIDVIEQGDLVNDMFVVSNNGYTLSTLEIDYESSTLGCTRYVELEYKQIETVVTHEQLERERYEVKRECKH